MRACAKKATLVTVILVAIAVSVLAYPYIMAHFSGNGSNSNKLFSEEPGKNVSRSCKCECFDVLTVEYAVHVKDQKIIRTERVLERLVPEPGDVYDAVLKPEAELRNLDVEVHYVVESEKDGVTLKVMVFRSTQRSPEMPGTIYTIVALNPQSRFGFVLYRVSDRDAFAYIVIPGDVPKAQYITVEFTEHASMHDYLKSINHGLAKVSYMNGENKWSLIADEIDRTVEAIKTMKHPELSSILEFRGTLSALVVDGGWNCFINCAQICGVMDLTLGAICSITCGLCTLGVKKLCTVCGYCLIVLGAATVGCLLGCGIGCLITGG